MIIARRLSGMSQILLKIGAHACLMYRRHTNQFMHLLERRRGQADIANPQKTSCDMQMSAKRLQAEGAACWLITIGRLSESER